MEALGEKLKNLPDRPGVYIMKDETGDIIYIGKAISIKNRVRQYFQSSRGHSPKVRTMVGQIWDFDYIITDSELEALILECNLIKKHRPKYNVLLKDDKSYPYIKITTEEEYPRIIITRKVKKDNNKYFGPYTSPKAVRKTIELIRKIFPIRSCNKKIKQDVCEGRPCLYFHINQCQGPCQGNVSREEYGAMIKQVDKFLDGKHDDLLDELRLKMIEASNNLEFEKAALLRDRIAAVEQILEGQKIVYTNTREDTDVIAFAQDEVRTVAQLFFIRNGKLMGAEQFVLGETKDTELVEIIASFIKQFYFLSLYIPKVVLIQEEIQDTHIISKWLSDKKGYRVYLHAPKRGEKKELVNMALLNATDALQNIDERLKREMARTEGAVRELAQYLGLDRLPYRIEAFDISNIQGTQAVGSMVVFQGGRPQYGHYRRFKIKGIQGPDDYASMAQVVRRRFKRGLEEKKRLEDTGEDPVDGKFSYMPDLVLIDGGKGQLNIAVEVIRSLGLAHIPVISLAETFDQLYVEGKDSPVILPKNSMVLHLLQRIRDEAHRFAISYHRSLRTKSITHSVLEDIPGIGSKRSKALLKEFGSVEAIKKATLEELSDVKGMNRQVAQNVLEYFR